MVTTRDEILIQRCVDGELSTEERHELLNRMQQLPDGWKTLACSFIEDQLFADAAVEATGRSVSSLSILRPTLPVQNRGRNWFAHPVTSVVLLLCVAFLAGLLAKGGGVSQPRAASIAANDLKTNDRGGSNVTPKPDAIMSSTLVSAKPDYSVRFEADGMSPRELPVYEDSAAFLSRFMEDQKQMASKNGSDGKEASESQINFLRIRMDDGRTIVVPFEDDRPRFQ